MSLGKQEMEFKASNGRGKLPSIITKRKKEMMGANVGVFFILWQEIFSMMITMLSLKYEEESSAERKGGRVGEMGEIQERGLSMKQLSLGRGVSLPKEQVWTALCPLEVYDYICKGTHSPLTGKDCSLTKFNTSSQRRQVTGFQ